MNIYRIIIRFIYRLPLPMVLIGMVLWIVCWTAVLYGLTKLLSATRSRQICFLINCILLLAGLTAILRMTLMGRNPHTDLYDLRPLSILWGTKKPRDYWQVMLLNILLFIPFGTALPYCLTRITKKPVFASVICIFILSIIIELIQLVFNVGVFETDDILCNTAGGVLGTVSFILYRKAGEASF